MKEKHDYCKRGAGMVGASDAEDCCLQSGRRGLLESSLLHGYSMFVVADSEILFVVDPNRIYYPKLHGSNEKKVANSKRELKF